MADTPEGAIRMYAPLSGREKRRRPDPSLIAPPLLSRSLDQPRSFFANALRTPNKTGYLELLVVSIVQTG